MKLSAINCLNEINGKKKEIIITNHGIKYTITSDFYGIKITNDHDKCIQTFGTDNKNSIIIK